MSITAFDTDAEAISLANDCDFGLGSNVFSGDQVGRGFTNNRGTILHLHSLHASTNE